VHTTQSDPTSPLFPYTTLFRSYNSCETATADLVRTELNNPTKITKNIRNNVPKTTRDHFISTLANCSENNEWKQKLSRIVSSERSEEHTSELQSRFDIVCRLLL